MKQKKILLQHKILAGYHPIGCYNGNGFRIVL